VYVINYGHIVQADLVRSCLDVCSIHWCHCVHRFIASLVC